MKCKQCGHETEEGARFCQGCGSPLTVGSEAARPPEEPDAGPGGISCPKCGMENASGLKFCTGCGGPLVVGPEKDDTERLADELSETSREMAREAAAASARAASTAAKVGGSILGVVGVLLKRNWKIVVPVVVVIVVSPFIYGLYFKSKFNLISVPGGCFRMGSNSGDSDEKPVHEVCLDGFQMGKYEVTQKQWRLVMGSNPSKFSGCDECPVEQVSWDEVQEFIRKVGNGVRLPTEAEWEYACRSGGKDQEYAGGSDVGSVGWYDDNSGSKTHPVGGKAANGLGLYDMSGNVWEWVQDVYASDAYGEHARKNPIYDGSGSFRVSRGGSWGNNAGFLRCADRYDSAPGGRGRSSNLGFRLARTP